MRNPNSKNPLEYTFNKNIIGGKKIFGINTRNIIEAIISIMLAGAVITAIPFVNEVKILLLIVAVIGLGGFNLKGIRQRSVSEMAIAWFRYKKNKRELHLRGPEYVKEKKNTINAGYSDKSVAEELIGKLKKRVDRFLAENSEDEVSEDN